MHVLISLATASIIALLLQIGWIPTGLIDRCKVVFEATARRQIALLLLIPAASFAVNTTIAIRNGIPRARVQDEFSYLLAADTFSHGRLTNPTPPFWEHFETPHELMRPSYMSKYPPGQGLMLAAGQVLAGMPITGVWVATGLACGFIYWMLLTFVRPTWAFVGGILAVLHPLLIHWSSIYWGGSLAVLAGAMVVGAWGRLMLRGSVSSTIIMGLGLIILANTRPFEGLIFAAPLLIALTWHRRWGKQILILFALALPAAVMMGYYNFRITGHVLRLPFMEYSYQYDVYPKFWFLPKNAEPIYRNESMRLIHTIFERGNYDLLRTPAGLIEVSIRRLWILLTDFVDPCILFAPLFAVFFALRDVRLAWLGSTAVVFLIGLWTENFFLPHYAAPVTAVMLLLIVVGWQKLSECRLFGPTLSVAIAIGAIVGALISASSPVSNDSKRVGQFELIQQTPELQAGKHIIFVSYEPGHLMHDEWVYNLTDLENSPILWARDLGVPSDRFAAKYFADRQVWSLTVGKDSLRLNPGFFTRDGPVSKPY